VKVIAGLVEPTHGVVRVHIEGRSPTPIATVFQDFGIFPWKTVLANVAFGLRVSGIGRRVASSRARDALVRLGLGAFLEAYPAELSGGMRQRVAIARALVVEPEILLMDEPFASLDAQLREIMQDELVRLCEEDRRTVIFVTHSLEEAIVLGDRVLVMTARPGRIVADTRVPFGRPRDTHVRESREFGEVRAELWERLRSEVDAQLDAKSQESEESA
jgi:NitT/TauT family transport system ATP-binding protein